MTQADDDVTIGEIERAKQHAEDIIEQIDNRGTVTVEDVENIYRGFVQNFNVLNKAGRTLYRWHWNADKEKNGTYARKMRSRALQAEEQARSYADEVDDLITELDGVQADLDEFTDQEFIRAENPAAEKAYQNYLTILKLCK